MKLRPLKKNKKGLAESLVLIVTMLFVSAAVLFLVHYFSNSVISKLRESDINDSAEARNIMTQGENASNLFDLVFMLIFFAFVIGIIATAILIPTHPMYMLPFIIVLALCVLIAVPLSNGFEKMYDTGQLASSASHFTMTNHIMDNLPLYTLIIGAVGVIIMFTKRRAMGYAGVV